MRAWTGSVERVRRYAAARLARRLAVRGVADGLVWLRRTRGGIPRWSIALRPRLHVALAVHLRRSTVVHLYAGPRVHPMRATDRERHTSVLLGTRQVTVAGEGEARGAPALVQPARNPVRQVVSTRTVIVPGRVETRLASDLRTEREHSHSRLELRRSSVVAIPQTMPPVVRPSARRPQTLHDRSHTRSTTSVETRHEGGRTVERLVPLASTPLNMRVVARGAARPEGRPITAFASQPRPLAVAGARPPQVVESPPVERIEQSLRETMHVVAERTVRREIEKVLQPGAPQSRRLRESIQSELYDELVLERERLGER